MSLKPAWVTKDYSMRPSLGTPVTGQGHRKSRMSSGALFSMDYMRTWESHGDKTTEARDGLV